MSYMYLSTNIGVHFLAPYAPDPTPIVVTPESAMFSGTAAGFYTVKDVYGSAPLISTMTLCNLDGTPWISTNLNETRGFRNFAVVSSTGFKLESTAPYNFNAQILYASSFGYGQPANSCNMRNLQAKSILISNVTIPTIITLSTNASLVTTVSSLTLRDIGTGNPSSLYVSANTMYLGQTQIKPNVDLNYDIQVIASGSPWTPAKIPNLQFWFDGKDLSTMYADTSFSRTISTSETLDVWVDKSINQFSIIKNTLTNEPGFTYHPELGLIKGSEYMDANFTINPDKFTLCVVHSLSTNTLGNPYIYTFAPTPFESNGPMIRSYSGDNYTLITRFTESSIVEGVFNLLTQTSYNTIPGRPILPPVSRHMFTTIVDFFGSPSYLLARQDGLNAQQCNFAGIPISSVSSIGQGALGMLFGDFIAYNRILGEPELQKLEGYLMWKYNIQNLLSPNHPYAANPP